MSGIAEDIETSTKIDCASGSDEYREISEGGLCHTLSRKDDNCSAVLNDEESLVLLRHGKACPTHCRTQKRPAG